MTQASPILKSSRHAIHLTGDLREPAGPLLKYKLLVTLKKMSDRMRCFISDADASLEQLESVVEVLRQLLALEVFRDLLKAEGFTAIPAILADAIAGRTVSVPGTEASQKEPSQQLVGGICAEVLDLLQDCVVPPKMFGLLRQVLPGRQIEIVQVMIALERVKLDTARVFIALTPQSQLADRPSPWKQFAGITSGQFAAMEAEFADLTEAFQTAAKRHGTYSLELLVARGLADRLMENARVVRYLAQHFPRQLECFQMLLD